ncbi:MAG: SLBB domain-containing protein [Candidatus Marinimicrobia bacterium]|nr:SLBB domain-containing protein [Candidatus Neomarinimicrobiota bacterium]
MLRKTLLFIAIIPIFIYSQRFGVTESSTETTQELNDRVDKSNALSNYGEVLLDQKVDPETYMVGPGDKFKVAVASPFKSVSVLIISPTCNVMIPEIGSLDMQGLNLRAATNSIKTLIKNEIQGAKVFVDLLEVREFKVLVYGAVKIPGFHKANPVMRIYELSKLAEIKQMADFSKIIVIRGDGDTLSYNWYDLIDNGDLSQNPFPLEGDKIYIPYADHNKNAIAVRGAAEVTGYYPLKGEEPVFSFLNRFVDLMDVADMGAIYVIRQVNGNDEYIRVQKADMYSFRLTAGDIIQLLRVEPIRVNGYVKTPGVFLFIPGQNALDYIAAAGGALPNGNLKKIKVVRGDSVLDFRGNIIIQPGDIIEVERTYSDILFGEISILQFVTSTATIVLSYLAIKG